VDDASADPRRRPTVDLGEGTNRQEDSMSRFEVDSAQVSQASAAVKGSIGSISAEVDRMMTHLLDLQNSWKGQAASQFQYVVTDWRATQERVRASLEQVNAALTAAGASYAEVEDRNTRMFTR
jgi:WXG100 family type VII secretion target